MSVPTAYPERAELGHPTRESLLLAHVDFNAVLPLYQGRPVRFSPGLLDSARSFRWPVFQIKFLASLSLQKFLTRLMT